MASYTVRLNWKTDLDLIAMYMHPDFNFSKFMKMAVTAYARGDDSFYIIPPERKCEIGALKNVAVHFRLSEETEADVIDFLARIREGHGCSAMKIIFRTYMKYPYLEPYFSCQYEVPLYGFYKKGQGSAKEIPERIREIRNKAAISENIVKSEMHPNVEIYQEKPDTKHPVAEYSSDEKTSLETVYPSSESVISASNENSSTKEYTVLGIPARHLDTIQSVRQNEIPNTESSPTGVFRQEQSVPDTPPQEQAKQSSFEEELNDDEGVNEELFGMFGNMMNM